MNGLVLAEDGKKMSKRLKNYPDPTHVINEHGADALRLYLINSPVVCAQEFRFRESGVRDVVKDVFIPWLNSSKFFDISVIAASSEFFNDEAIIFDLNLRNTSSNIMDRWILAYTQSLISYVSQEMEGYRLYTMVVPRLLQFIDQLTNWYIRFNRLRLRGSTKDEKDTMNALFTLFEVLVTMAQLMAPFAPFMAEKMYQSLRNHMPASANAPDSVHYCDFPKQKNFYEDESIIRAVKVFQQVTDMGRVLRDQNTIPLKTPLRDLVVIHEDDQVLEDVKDLATFITGELNVKNLIVSSDAAKYGLLYQAAPNMKILGKRLGKKGKEILKAVKELSHQEILEFKKKGERDFNGILLQLDDVFITFKQSDEESFYKSNIQNGLVVFLNIQIDEELRQESYAREIIKSVQQLRKKSGLSPQDQIDVMFSSNYEALDNVIDKYSDQVYDIVKSRLEKKIG